MTYALEHRFVTEPIQLETARLLLISETAAMLRAGAEDRDELARLLGASIHPSWPPDEEDRQVRDHFGSYLAEHPDAHGYLGWAWLERASGKGEHPVLIGGGGFKGLPSADGTVEIGYSIVEECYGRGLATEAVRAMVEWVFRDPRVRRVIAHTLLGLRASQRVLEKNGFARSSELASDPDSIRFALTREEWAAATGSEGLSPAQ
jgi:ribosomal-protein-alanine N-acetyltransferase